MSTCGIAHRARVAIARVVRIVEPHSPPGGNRRLRLASCRQESREAGVRCTNRLREMPLARIEIALPESSPVAGCP